MSPSSQDAYAALQNFNNTRKSTSDILNEANAKYGVDDLTGRAKNYGVLVGNLQNSINAVDPSVTGRTSGSLVTEAQRSALVNREQQPLLKDLSTESQNYTNAQNDLNTARQQAGAYVTAVQGDQDTKYKALSDAYAAAVAAEQAAEQKRQYDADLAEKQREYNASLAASKAAASGYNLGNPAPASQPAASVPATDPIQQAAYNDVRTRVSTMSDAALRSDYAATAKSAGYGNAKDKAKLLFYTQLRPDLFGTVNINALANGGQVRF